MQPARAEGSENVIKIIIPGTQVGHSRVRSVRAANRAADPVPPLCKIHSVAGAFPDSVEVQPLNKRCVDSALADHILQKLANFIVRKRCNDRRLHTEAFSEASRDVILTAAFPGCKVPRGLDSALTRIEPEQDLAHGYFVKGVSAFLL